MVRMLDVRVPHKHKAAASTWVTHCEKLDVRAPQRGREFLELALAESDENFGT